MALNTVEEIRTIANIVLLRRLTKGGLISLTIWCDTNVHTCESIKTYLCEAFRSPIPVSFHHAGEELGISSKAKRKSGKIKKDLTDAINYYCLPTQARPPGLIQFSGTLAFLLGFPSLIVSLLCLAPTLTFIQTYTAYSVALVVVSCCVINQHWSPADRGNGSRGSGDFLRSIYRDQTITYR